MNLGQLGFFDANQRQRRILEQGREDPGDAKRTVRLLPRIEPLALPPVSDEPSTGFFDANLA